MKVWTDREGKKLTGKEFMSRWKDGLSKVTPLQQTMVSIHSTNIILFGLLAGIVITIIAFDKLWWVMIILIGALGNTLMQQLGLWQKKKNLEVFEKAIEDVKEVSYVS